MGSAPRLSLWDKICSRVLSRFQKSCKSRNISKCQKRFVDNNWNVSKKNRPNWVLQADSRRGTKYFQVFKKPKNAVPLGIFWKCVKMFLENNNMEGLSIGPRGFLLKSCVNYINLDSTPRFCCISRLLFLVLPYVFLSRFGNKDSFSNWQTDIFDLKNWL